MVERGGYGGCSLMRHILLFVLMAIAAVPADAAVTIDFYAREFGVYFPHGFVILKGHPDSDPRPVDGSYGFTAAAITPGILTGRVKGVVEPVPTKYAAGSERLFSLQLTDQQYYRVATVIQQWTNLPQPSYDLNTRNCVHFVADVARQIGLKVDLQNRFIKKPHAFLMQVRADNPILGNGTQLANGASIGAPRNPVAAVPRAGPVPAAAPPTAPGKLPMTPVEAARRRAAAGN